MFRISRNPNTSLLIRRTTQSLMLCVWMVLQPAFSASPDSFPKATPETTVIEAVGDEGGMWQVKFHNEAFIDFSFMPTFSSVTGTLDGTFVIDPQHVQAILVEAKNQKFNELPKHLLPAICAMHGPMYRIEIRQDGVLHSVQAYWPGYMPLSPELSRFWTVWDKIWAPFPLAPKVKNRFLASAEPLRNVYCTKE